jgi:hypothetical protein
LCLNLKSDAPGACYLIHIKAVAHNFGP